MKHVLFLAAVLFLITGCANKKTEQGSNVAIEIATVEDAKVYTLDELLANAEDLLEETVTVRGSVTHTCVHAGKRCFIVGEDPNVSMRVEAGGEIGGFNRELVGSELTITGVLKERRLTKEYIDQYEKEVNEKAATEDGSAESCAAELSNIQGMKDWMEANGKDFYAIYFMDGESYEIID